MVKGFDAVMSLGCCCEISFLQERMKVNNIVTGPFDWIHTNNFDDVLFLLLHRFRDFLDGFDMRANPYMPKKWKGELQLYPIHYPNVFIPHYTSDEFIQKASRRIERLYKVLSSSQRVLFIRKHDYGYMKDNHQNPLSMVDGEKFCDVVSQINPDLDFFVLLINEYRDKNQKDHMSKSNRCILINTYTIPVECCFENGELYWTNIFDILSENDFNAI